MVNVVYEVLLKKLSFLRQWGNINLFFSGSSSVSLLKYVMNVVLFNTLPIGLICSLNTVCVLYMIKLVKLLMKLYNDQKDVSLRLQIQMGTTWWICKMQTTPISNRCII